VHGQARAAELLAGCLGVSTDRVRIDHRPGSAPETNLPGWTLSLSYARSLALIAIGHGVRVGVDLVALADLGGEAGTLARAARWAEMEAALKCRGAPSWNARRRPQPSLEPIEVPVGWVARLARLVP
jgi:hypothetical protein